MLKGVKDGAWGIKRELECCLHCAPLLEPNGLALGKVQDTVVSIWTKTTPWTGGGLGRFLLLENGIG